MPERSFIPYQPPRLPADEMLARARSFYERMDTRRSVRHFSTEPVPRELIEYAIRAASTSPSGAHRQPWRFVVVSQPDAKRAIREAVEAEERASYEGGRMPDEWLEALAPMGATWQKPYIETAPWVVVAFEIMHGLAENGSTRKNYYVKESCGVACGLFVVAVHEMGLATLTHTPSPMGFLGDILGRPKNERPMMLFPVGYPAADATAPDLRRKSLEEVSVWEPPISRCASTE